MRTHPPPPLLLEEVVCDVDALLKVVELLLLNPCLDDCNLVLITSNGHVIAVPAVPPTAPPMK